MTRPSARPPSASDDESRGEPIPDAPVPSIPAGAMSLPPRSLPPLSATDLAGALHEVSNALTVVVGWIEQARESAGDPLALARALDVAGARARKARVLVRRAIGADVPDEAPVAVATAVADVAVGLEPEVRRTGVDLAVVVEPDAADVAIGMGGVVVQILTNLLLNGIAASPSGGGVTLDVRLGSSSRVVFGVSDDGPGVPTERRATIFGGGVSTRVGGAGIGLRHAADLAREAGGRLALADAVPGLGRAGARFELEWPLDRIETPRPVSIPPASAPPLDGTRILVVEDDDAVIDLLDMALSARGASVVAVKRRVDLASTLATGNFDAALLDISPIQEDVPGALAAVRIASPGARLIVISGSAVAIPGLADADQPAWVRKPFEIAEIVRALRD